VNVVVRGLRGKDVITTGEYVELAAAKLDAGTNDMIGQVARLTLEESKNITNKQQEYSRQQFCKGPGENRKDFGH
jgi:hypothetical protein